jgi:hypothetical protein
MFQFALSFKSKERGLATKLGYGFPIGPGSLADLFLRPFIEVILSFDFLTHDCPCLPINLSTYGVDRKERTGELNSGPPQVLYDSLGPG